MTNRVQLIVNRMALSARKLLSWTYWSMVLYGKTALSVLALRYIPRGTPVIARHPKVLQFPITYSCNLDCIMCNMARFKRKGSLGLDQYKHILKNKFFKKIKSVGINGGEPFLYKDIIGLFKTMPDSLPSLKDIYIITNGTYTDIIINKLPLLKQICATRSIRLHVSISIDGINEVHDRIRGKDGVFKAAGKTCLAIKAQQNKYCDSFGLICTITKENIEQINEVEEWVKRNGFIVNYSIATLHERLDNKDKYNKFSIFSDDHAKMLSAEFFYSKFLQTRSKDYFAHYLYIVEGRRACKCTFMDDGCTVDPEGKLSYCATKSKSLGSLFSGDAWAIYRANTGYRKELVENECQNCSQYVGRLTLKNEMRYNREIMKNMISPFFSL